MSLTDLVDRVAVETGDDPSTIRTYLDPFVEDGAITDEAIEATITDVAQILATAETRVDLATQKRESVRETISASPDLAIVSVRDRNFTDQLAALRADVDELGRTLTSVRTGLNTPVALYCASVDFHELTTEAQRVVRVAHDLETDLGAFDAWLRSAPRRHDAFMDEIDAAESAATSLITTLETLQSTAEPDPDRWFDATVQTRVLGLVVDDLHTEAADLREWADRDEKPFPTDVDDRLEALREKAAACASALEDRPDWEAAYDARLDRLEAEFAAVDPPVAWDRIDRYVAAVRDGTRSDEPT